MEQLGGHMTKKILGVLLLAAFCLISLQTSAQQYPRRESITLPADAKVILLAQMLGHIVGLDTVITALGRGDYKFAAEVASGELGTPRFQDADVGQDQDQGPNLGIGQHLPAEFRAISRRFRKAANEFAELAHGMPDAPSTEQHQALAAALGKITNQCRICHDSVQNRIDAAAEVCEGRRPIFQSGRSRFKFWTAIAVGGD
jgi:hypothetical protein